jgi:hypothetical protein
MILRRLTALLAALALSACGEPTTAPWHFGYMTSTFAETPVTTELHTYDLDAGFNSFKIRGIPLKLTFPKKYYNYSENLSGGPQHEVILGLDGFSLRPVLDVVRERYGTREEDDTWAKVNGSGLGPKWVPGPYQDEMTVRISSRNGATYTEEEYPGGPVVVRWRLDTRGASNLYKNAEGSVPYENFKILDEACSHTKFSSKDVAEPIVQEQVLPKTPATTYLEQPNIFAFNPDKTSPVKGGQCYKNPAHCFVFVEHRQFSISINMKRSRLCAFWPSYYRIPAFIDQHAAYPFPL